MDISLSRDFNKANQLLVQGRYTRSRKWCMAALAKDPTNLRIVAMRVRLDVLAGIISQEEAIRTIQDLITENPGDCGLQLTLIVLEDRPENRPENRETMVANLRLLLERFPDDARIQYSLAQHLLSTQTTRDEAWSLWKSGLQSTPIPTTCYKSMAYTVAKRLEPLAAKQALLGAGWSERLIIKTRSLGFQILYGVFLSMVVVAVLLRSIQDPTASLLLIAVAAIWGGSIAFMNDAVCCARCRNIWLVFIGWSLLLYVAESNKFFFFAIAIITIIAGLSRAPQKWWYSGWVKRR